MKVEKGRFLVESHFKSAQGDSFKILREGKEVGGATYGGSYARGFYLYSKTRLFNGDGVFVTTDGAAGLRSVQGEVSPYPLHIKLRFAENERAVASADGLEIFSEQPLQAANSTPLSEQEVKACFLKTDGLPVRVEFDSIEIVGALFMPKSAMNAFRRAFYAAVCKRIASGDRTQFPKKWTLEKLSGRNEKIAVLSNDFKGSSATTTLSMTSSGWAPSPR